MTTRETGRVKHPIPTREDHYELRYAPVTKGMKRIGEVFYTGTVLRSTLAGCRAQLERLQNDPELYSHGARLFRIEHLADLLAGESPKRSQGECQLSYTWRPHCSPARPDWGQEADGTRHACYTGTYGACMSN